MTPWWVHGSVEEAASISVNNRRRPLRYRFHIDPFSGPWIVSEKTLKCVRPLAIHMKYKDVVGALLLIAGIVAIMGIITAEAISRL
jgi:hypothetical protein